MAFIDYLIVTGNIGTGKTTTVQCVSNLLPDCTAFYEDRDIYLARFYEDPLRFAFLNQLSYSLQFLQQAMRISTCNNVVIQDRSIYDTHEVFSRMRLADGLISGEEFTLLDRIYEVAGFLAQPTLMVMLDTPVDVSYERFLKRAHDKEIGLTKQLLDELREKYLNWFDHFDRSRKILITTQDLNQEEVAEQIVQALKT